MSEEKNEESKESPIDWMNEFVLTGSFGSAYDFLNSIDLIVRVHRNKGNEPDARVRIERAGMHRSTM